MSVNSVIKVSITLYHYKINGSFNCKDIKDVAPKCITFIKENGIKIWETFTMMRFQNEIEIDLLKYNRPFANIILENCPQKVDKEDLITLLLPKSPAKNFSKRETNIPEIGYLGSKSVTSIHEDEKEKENFSNNNSLQPISVKPKNIEFNKCCNDTTTFETETPLSRKTSNSMMCNYYSQSGLNMDLPCLRGADFQINGQWRCDKHV